MSTTECITQTSLSPTKSPNARRPEAHGDTSSFGTPTGSACIAVAPSSAPSAPPRQSTPCDRGPSANRRTTISRTPSRISATAAPREPAARTSSSVVPAGARRPRARVTSAAMPRLAEDARVDHDGVDAERRQAVAHVGDLVTLGVERADERDRGHQTAGAALAASAARRWSIDSRA